MGKASGEGKVFVFLQGPHGPFFFQLSRVLRSSGAEVFKIGFNQGDRAFWREDDTYLPYTGKPEGWAAEIREVLVDMGVTDIVLYGDTRHVHSEAIKAARALGITVHCFEEGYVRPYWVTYERGGVNGHSRLVDMSVDEMRAEIRDRDLELPDAPARWGDMRQHAFYGALYHGHILFRNGAYKNYKTHRDVSVLKEFRLHFRRLLSMPLYALQRRAASRRIRRDGYVYHLALLQLGHDSSIQHHSNLRSMPEFIRLTIEGFASGAPTHHHLVIKAHPLEDGRYPLRKITMETAAEYGVADRVQFVRGGKLAGLMNFARTVVTVNSTAAQQALWRGLPLKAFGNSVYHKPEFVSEQPLAEFFADPWRPDARAYRDYRHYLLETSQVMGGFYSAKSRRRLIRGVVDQVLAEQDPYDMLHRENATPRQQLRVIK
ncbi:MAG: capsular biosynthesis protein [Alphaproteobacteria bacterium]|nr:capsular biosynthesis protein [Alphaproteobacteria bacterium]